MLPAKAFGFLSEPRPAACLDDLRRGRGVVQLADFEKVDLPAVPNQIENGVRIKDGFA